MGRYTLAATAFSMAATVCIFYALLTPNWASQTYANVSPEAFQGFGLWRYVTSGTLDVPFIARPDNSVSYRDVCAIVVLTRPQDTRGPGETLGFKANTLSGFQASPWCGAMHQVVTLLLCLYLALSCLMVVASVMAVRTQEVGWPEKIMGKLAFSATVFGLVGGVLYLYYLQSALLAIPQIATEYELCQNGQAPWSCWGVGTCFYVMAASVMLIGIAEHLAHRSYAAKQGVVAAQARDVLTLSMNESALDEVERQEKLLRKSSSDRRGMMEYCEVERVSLHAI